MQTHVNVGCMMHLSFHAAVYHHLNSRTYTAAVIRPRCLYRQIFKKFRFEISEILRAQWNGTFSLRALVIMFFRLGAALFRSKICKLEDFSSEVARVARAQVRNARDFAAQILSLEDIRAKERLLEV